MRKFKEIPNGLKKLVYIRCGIAAIFLLFTLAVYLLTRQFVLVVPCLAIFMCLLVNVGILLHDCLKDKYIAITGTCTSMERSWYRNRLKTVYITSDKGLFKIPVRHKLSSLQVGDEMTIYVSTRTMTYQHNERCTICGYYAIVVSRDNDVEYVQKSCV